MFINDYCIFDQLPFLICILILIPILLWCNISLFYFSIVSLSLYPQAVLNSAIICNCQGGTKSPHMCLMWMQESSHTSIQVPVYWPLEVSMESFSIAMSVPMTFVIFTSLPAVCHCCSLRDRRELQFAPSYEDIEYDNEGFWFVRHEDAESRYDVLSRSSYPAVCSDIYSLHSACDIWLMTSNIGWT